MSFRGKMGKYARKVRSKVVSEPKSPRSRVDRVEERGRGTWYADFPKHGTIGVYSFSTFHVNLGRVPGTTIRNAIAVNSSST
jgi:hypothetical protein